MNQARTAIFVLRARAARNHNDRLGLTTVVGFADKGTDTNLKWNSVFQNGWRLTLSAALSIVCICLERF